MRAVFPFLALLATIISTEAGASENPVFHSRPGSTAPFSPAVRVGDTIYLSGQIGAAADGSVPPAMADQAKLAMENVKAALTLAGATFDDVVKCTVMLADMSKWGEFNIVYKTYFKAGRLPARSAFGVNGLAVGAGVEVECIAYRPLRASR